LRHAFDNGKDCLYEVKWLGYENAEDRTWEPEANL
jgi:chromobox protein 1